MTTQTQNQTSSANKISSYLTLIVLVVLALSVVAMFSAGYAYTIGNEVAASFLLIIGFFAMGLSVAVLYQSRRRTVAMKIDAPKVMTTIECKCGSKTVREFQRGDYVFKELDVPCQKCPNAKQMITGIFKEVKEKEKTYSV
jgi:hypothetical protein